MMPTLAVAPMLDCTDKHARFLYRLISKHTTLYTEMVVAQALQYRDPRRWLDYHPAEHPIILQLAGNDPDDLAHASRLAAHWGYDAINLNVGCPSDKVTAGNFGACLFLEPERVATCVAAMHAASLLPVSVKTRIGVDARDQYEDLHDFVTQVSQAGCHTFIIHARKAWLTGLNPAQNRTIPPLHYETVYRLKHDFPALTISINGGINTIHEAWQLCQQGGLNGAMLGRAIYANPYLLAEADTVFYGTESKTTNIVDILSYFCDYLEGSNQATVRTATRHLQGLFKGQAGARQWRKSLGNVQDAQGLRTAIAALNSTSPLQDDPDNVQHLGRPCNHCPPK